MANLRQRFTIWLLLVQAFSLQPSWFCVRSRRCPWLDGRMFQTCDVPTGKIQISPRRWPMYHWDPLSYIMLYWIGWKGSNSPTQLLGPWIFACFFMLFDRFLNDLQCRNECGQRMLVIITKIWNFQIIFPGSAFSIQHFSVVSSYLCTQIYPFMFTCNRYTVNVVLVAYCWCFPKANRAFFGPGDEFESLGQLCEAAGRPAGDPQDSHLQQRHGGCEGEPKHGKTWENMGKPEKWFNQQAHRIHQAVKKLETKKRTSMELDNLPGISWLDMIGWFTARFAATCCFRRIVSNVEFSMHGI